jgi:hypothetical protein
MRTFVREQIAVFTTCLVVLPSCSMRRASHVPPTVPASGWEEVSRLSSGQRIRVKQKSGKTVTGRLTAAEAQALVIGDRRIPRDDVQQVERVLGDSPFNGMAIGAAIGFTSGFAGEGLIYHAAGSATGYPDTYSWAAGVFGAISGAVAGLIIDASRKKHVTVYRVP